MARAASGKGNTGKKEMVKAYNPQVPFPQRLHKAKLEEKFSKFLNMLIGVNHAYIIVKFLCVFIAQLA